MSLLVRMALLVALANAFHVQPNGMTRKSNTSLQMGLFDFKPVHGSGTGSGESDLDEQFRLQQEMLEARRDHINYDSLHKKYSKEKLDLDVFGLGEKHISDKFQDSYVEGEENTPQENEGFKFPWDLKP